MHNIQDLEGNGIASFSGAVPRSDEFIYISTSSWGLILFQVGNVTWKILSGESRATVHGTIKQKNLPPRG